MYFAKGCAVDTVHESMPTAQHWLEHVWCLVKKQLSFAAMAAHCRWQVRVFRGLEAVKSMAGIATSGSCTLQPCMFWLHASRSVCLTAITQQRIERYWFVFVFI